MASTQSLRWPEAQQVKCDGCFVHSVALELRWEREMQTVHPALEPPGSHRTASWRQGRSASPSHFCTASVVQGQLGSACRSVPVPARLGEVRRSSQCWFESRRPPGDWGGESLRPSSRLHRWTGNGWPLRHTHWTRLCIYPGVTGPSSQQLEGRIPVHIKIQGDGVCVAMNGK